MRPCSVFASRISFFTYQWGICTEACACVCTYIYTYIHIYSIHTSAAVSCCVKCYDTRVRV